VEPHEDKWSNVASLNEKSNNNMLDSAPLLQTTEFPSIRRGRLTTVQANLGYRCNLSCAHCHVNAGPKRSEMMSRETVDLLLNFIEKQKIETLDLTGGAPEMNPYFCYLVEAARERGVTVIDRCNLTILLEPGYEAMAQFLADQGVVITASLPCYQEENVEQQRGKGVYQQSIDALKKLNDLGYGIKPELSLNLVYNPIDAVLPPPQQGLQQDYQRELKQRFGIEFNQLFVITNMPIKRFGSVLLSHGQFDNYMNLLKTNFSNENLATVMCRDLISVDWQGYVYDCDFNQMLEEPLIFSDKSKTHLTDLMAANIHNNEIVVGEHCYACTAGQGSSCGGALND
jgi:radical SAM/Cys-rich protein